MALTLAKNGIPYLLEVENRIN